MDIAFNPLLHEYRIGGFRVPSVTQIIDDVVPGWHAEDYHLILGMANHLCYSMLGKGLAFECDPTCEPYVATWRRWATENRVKVLNTETVVGSKSLQYAGCLDALAMVDKETVVLDYKSSLTPAVRWQLAGYSIALGKSYPRLGVEIRPDGYKMQWRRGADSKRDDQEWLAILTAYRCRRISGINEKRSEQ